MYCMCCEQSFNNSATYIQHVETNKHKRKWANERPMNANLAANNDPRTFLNMIEDELEEINSLCKQDHLKLAK